MGTFGLPLHTDSAFQTGISLWLATLSRTTDNQSGEKPKEQQLLLQLEERELCVLRST